MRMLRAIVVMLCVCALANSSGLASGYGRSRNDDQAATTAASSAGRLSASDAGLTALVASNDTERGARQKSSRGTGRPMMDMGPTAVTADDFS